MDSSRHILAEIQHRLALWRADNFLTAKGIHHLNPRAALCPQYGIVKGNLHRFPPSAKDIFFFRVRPGSLLRYRRIRPSGDFQRRIVYFPIINLGKDYRAVGPRPIGIRTHPFLASVLIAQEQFHGKTGPVAVIVSRLGQPHYALVPAGGQHCPGGVYALFQVICHLIGLV